MNYKITVYDSYNDEEPLQVICKDEQEVQAFIENQIDPSCADAIKSEITGSTITTTYKYGDREIAAEIRKERKKMTKNLLWIVMADKDFEPEPELTVFGTLEEAESYFRENVQNALENDGETTDYDGNTIDECVEIGVANLGYMRVNILPAYNKITGDECWDTAVTRELKK